MENEKKAIEYATVILEHLSELFNETNELGTFIDLKADDFDGNAFIYAMSSFVPKHFYEHLTKEKFDVLGFNHLVNRLCFQFLEK